jgi:hypothetical protein
MGLAICCSWALIVNSFCRFTIVDARRVTEVRAADRPWVD